MLSFILAIICVFFMVSLFCYLISLISSDYKIYEMSETDMIIGYIPFSYIKHHFKWSKTNNIWVSKKGKTLCPNGIRDATAIFNEEKKHKQKVLDAKKEVWK